MDGWMPELYQRLYLATAAINQLGERVTLYDLRPLISANNQRLSFVMYYCAYDSKIGPNILQCKPGFSHQTLASALK